MGMVRYPLPITNVMLARANATNEAKPRYSTGADWQGGAPGNEEDVATATSSLTDVSGVTVAPYAPKTQAAKAALMVPPLTIVDDLGKDYGAYTNLAGRTGPITPATPYPDKTTAPIVVGVTPNFGGVAGGFAITISGAGFAGTANATGATIGGTACTAFVVVDTNTITAVAPAKAAGAYDLIVNSARGASQTGIKVTYS